MTRSSIIALSLVLLSPVLRAESEENKKAADRLIEAMKAESAQSAKDHPDRGQYLSFPQQYSTLFHDEDANLDQINVGYYQSDEVSNAFEALKELRKKSIAVSSAKRQAEVEALLTRVKTTLESAKEPSDLDGILNELTKAPAQSRWSGNYNDPAYGQMMENLNSVRNFVTSWQDYLQAKESGSPEQVQSALGSLISYSNYFPQIPRSKLLAMQAEARGSKGDPVDIIQGIKSLDQIRDAMMKMRSMQRPSGGDYNSEISNALSALSTLDRSYREFKGGLSINIELYNSYSEQRNPLVDGKILELRAMLMREVLPRYIDAPEGVAPRDGETAIAFLDRVAGEAKAKEDAALAYRAREARKILARNMNTNAVDATGMNTYVSAQKQEAAGQFMLAVVSYQNALKSGSDLVPGKTIGDRLEAIKAAHPEEYKQGMDRFLEPPVADRFPPGFNQQRMEAERQRNASASLVIPPPASPEKSAAPAKTSPEEPKAPKKADEK